MNIIIYYEMKKRLNEQLLSVLTQNCLPGVLYPS